MIEPRVDPLYVTRSITPDKNLLFKYQEGILSRGMYTNFGTVEHELTKKIGERFGISGTLLFNNGTIALLIALLSLPRKEGKSKIITTPFTFPATVHCIKLAGYDVDFCDIDERTFNICPHSLREKMTSSTAAVLGVHVYGNPCDTDAIQAICREFDAFELYDAAHCFDAYKGGQPLYALGHFSVASLHATKLMHTGEGGAIFSSDHELLNRAKSLMNFGIRGEDVVEGIGLNGKMSEFGAAVGLSVLPQVTSEISHRSQVASLYKDKLDHLDWITYPAVEEDVVKNHQYFPIIVGRDKGLRDKIWSSLRAKNILSRKYFSPILTDCNPYCIEFKSSDFPNSQKAASSVLCLPIHSGVKKNDIDEIVKTIEGSGLIS